MPAGDRPPGTGVPARDGPGCRERGAADVADLTRARSHGKRIAVLATDGVERIELTEPVRAAREAGADVDLVSLDAGSIQGVHGLDKADTFDVDRSVSEASADEYDGLVIPGSVKNPDKLRMDERAVSLVRAFVAQGKPVAAICHGPWLLVEADVVRGRTLTS